MSEYQRDLDRRLRDTVTELASGAKLRLDDPGHWVLVRDLPQPQGDVIDRLMHRGWLESMANGGTCQLSDAGLRAYLHSTDELGDGKLIDPTEYQP